MQNKRLEEVDIIIRNFRANSYLISSKHRAKHRSINIQFVLSIILALVLVVIGYYCVETNKPNLLFMVGVGMLVIKGFIMYLVNEGTRRFKEETNEYKNIK